MSKRFYTNAGTPIKLIRRLQLDADGYEHPAVVGKQDFQAFIDSFESSTNINSILARFQNGDMSALNAHALGFGDFVGMPTSPIEFANARSRLDELFMRLPLEKREIFDNDSNKFFASIGTEKFTSVFKPSEFSAEKEVSEGLDC